MKEKGLMITDGEARQGKGSRIPKDEKGNVTYSYSETSPENEQMEDS